MAERHKAAVNVGHGGPTLPRPTPMNNSRFSYSLWHRRPACVSTGETPAPQSIGTGSCSRSSRWLHAAARRRAYILIVVLGFTAVVTSLGWAFLQSHSTVMPEAVNRYGAVRAQYLAESGVAIATHFLMYPPTTVAACGFWTGASGIAIDATNDYTDVAVTQDSGTTDAFTITAIGVDRNPDATVRGKRTITAKVLRPAVSKIKIPYAVLGNADQMSSHTFEIPSKAEIYGDLHAEGGAIWSSGKCTGRVEATDWICWSPCGGSGPPSAFASYAASFPFPAISTSGYSTYQIRGSTYTATPYGNSSMSTTQAASLNSSLDTTMSTNPGRIVTKNGNLTLAAGVNLNCSLVIQGNLTLDGSGVQVTAVQNYPVLVLSGNILPSNDNRGITLIGPVLIAGQILDNNKNSFALSVTGALITKKGFNLNRPSSGTYRFTYDCNRSVYWDFAIFSFDETPITILSWKEN